jgi:uncharacterized repeat protein (TIGR02543 family)
MDDKYQDGTWSVSPALGADGVTGAVTCTAAFELEEFTVTFDAGGDLDDPAAQIVKYGQKATKPTDPENEGYHVAAWMNGEDEWDFATEVTSDLDLVAQWAANTYTVKFDKNAEAATGTMADQLFTYDVAQNLTANAFERAGYTFFGWNTAANGSGTAYADKASVKNLASEQGAVATLYAQWTANTYTVKFDKNAEAATGTMADQLFTYDVAQNLTANAFERVGYTFLDWNTAANGSGTAYADKASVKNLASEQGAAVTLYAQWTDAIIYKITYDLKGGALADGETNPEVYTVESPDITLKNPTKAGYEFAGWTGTGIEGASKQVVILTGSTGDRSYVATWSDAVEYKITYNNIVDGDVNENPDN